MSKVSKFGFTNTTASTKVETPIAIAPVSNYALKQDEPTTVELDNKTCPIDQGELLSYKCQDVKRVATTQDILFPAPVSSGLQYVIKLEEILSTTDAADPSYRVDEPIVAYLTIRHPKSGNITSDTIGQVIDRLMGACRKADGSWRFNELMRSSLKPTVD